MGPGSAGHRLRGARHLDSDGPAAGHSYALERPFVQVGDLWYERRL